MEGGSSGFSGACLVSLEPTRKRSTGHTDVSAHRYLETTVFLDQAKAATEDQAAPEAAEASLGDGGGASRGNGASGSDGEGPKGGKKGGKEKQGTAATRFQRVDPNQWMGQKGAW